MAFRRVTSAFVLALTTAFVLALTTAGVGAAQPQDDAVTRVSVTTNGEQARGHSYSAAVTTSGDVIAFDSDAINLVSADDNGASDVFIRNLQTATTRSISVGGNGGSYAPSISGNGKLIAFESEATSLVRRDNNVSSDIFVRDRKQRMTKLISVRGTRRRANGDSYDPSISLDGRAVAFWSYATNLTRGDTNSEADVFVRDLSTGRTRRISVHSSGRQANDLSYSPSISGDGRFVAFGSLASNLVGGDDNDSFDAFLHDLRNRTTRRVSVGIAGSEANGSSFDPAVSHDGQVIAFWSKASNLTTDDTNNGADVFVRDITTGTTERISVGARPDGGSLQPSISDDGHLVAFFSFRQLVPEDANDEADIYVYERATRVLQLVSTPASGMATDGPSHRPAISGDGSAVAFHSFATNLVEADTNGVSDVFVRALP